MLHEYRRKEPIKAERFNGSDEMIKRYHITVKHYDLGTPDPDFFIAYVMDDHGRDLYPDPGDWIITYEKGSYTILSDSDFRRTYERCD